MACVCPGANVTPPPEFELPLAMHIQKIVSVYEIAADVCGV
jgi:hypothetical protein